MATIPTTLMGKDGEKDMTCNTSDIAKYEARGWSVSENQPEPIKQEAPVDEPEVSSDEDEPEVSSDDAEPTPEDKKKIDELIAKAEAEKVIDPEKPDVPPEISSDEAKKLAEVQQPEQPKQQPEDDVVMPAE